MSDLIDRQAVIDALVKAIKKDPFYATSIDLEPIDRQPTAEPKKGEWIVHDPCKQGLGKVYECSNCGEMVDCVIYNYCPNCGADMRGEEDDHTAEEETV